MGNAVTSKDAVRASLAVPSMKWRVKALPNAAQRKTATLASRPSMWLRRKFSIKLLMISAPTFRRSVHQGVTKELYEAPMSDLKQKYDASTVAVMRQALNEGHHGSSLLGPEVRHPARSGGAHPSPGGLRRTRR
jgi:hypothetical protein